MKWIKTRVAFSAADPETAADLIADIFLALGVKGVIMESPDDSPGIDWAGQGPLPPDHHAVTGFFPEDGRLETSLEELEKRLSYLESKIGVSWRISADGIEEQNWAESWKDHFHPVKISEKIVVKPTWRQYRPEGGEIIVELDPGMAFGTGTHPSTALCLRLMERFMRPGFRVLDIGTGSGILLTAAAKLGAAALFGTDCDPVAVEVARQNLLLNGVSENIFRLETCNLADAFSGKADLAAANIMTETIVPMIPQIPGFLGPGGIFIASGILAESSQTVSQALEKSGLGVIEILTEGEWAGLAAGKSTASN
ncbi:MAG: 50S ribosomal protein L11 methyltransferase [Desulfosalsimonas sp.]